MDALHAGGECTFCVMHDSLERHAIDYLMGPSVAYMEDHIRMETDAKGFCPRHYRALYNSQNRLGLALMLYTHMKKQNASLDSIIGDMERRGKRGLFQKPSHSPAERLAEAEHSCFVCDMAEDTFKRYCETFFILWKKEGEVRELVKKGKGFCLPHFAMAADMAYEKLDSAEYKRFCEIAGEAQRSNMKRIEDELEWFVKKFDYRFTAEPWGNSKDSPERAILKLASAEVKTKDGEIIERG